MPRKLLILIFCVFATHIGRGQIITTIAGGNSGGLGNGGPDTLSELAGPIGVSIDNVGNIYIADRDFNRIRKIDTTGIITTIAGNGRAGFSGDNGPATDAILHAPLSIAFDNKGNIYFSDVYNQRIRKIDTNGIIATIAGNGTSGLAGDNDLATKAELNYPHGIAIDAQENIYIADFYNNCIRIINSLGIIYTYAGITIGAFSGDNGPASLAQLYRPYGIALDRNGNLYIADISNCRVRKINTDGIITTVAGNGTPGNGGDGGAATDAQMAPTGVFVDNFGNILIADAGDNVVRKVNTSVIISTIAGNGVNGYNGDNQPATLAKLYFPTCVTVDKDGNILIADLGNDRIRKIINALGIQTEPTWIGQLIVYPNPSKGKFIIHINSILFEMAQLEITNVVGKILDCRIVNTNTDNEINLDVPDGLYILTANTPAGMVSQKLMISH